MSTRSYIGLEFADGSISVIYCHSDGHLSSVGRILLEHYNTEEQVMELMGMGYASRLAPTLEDSCFYIRDRGEAPGDNEANYFASLDEFVAENWDEPYTYIFTAEGKWMFWPDTDFDKARELTAEDVYERVAA